MNIAKTFAPDGFFSHPCLELLHICQLGLGLPEIGQFKEDISFHKMFFIRNKKNLVHIDCPTPYGLS